MSLMLRVQLRPYQVIRPFVFNGMSFEPGDVFDPKKADCNLPKLDRLVSNRYLDATAMPDETKQKQVAKEPVQEVVQEVVVETAEPEVQEVQEEAKPEEVIEPEPEVQEESVQEVAQEEQPTTTRARRRSY